MDILICEDELIIAEYLKATCNSAGFHVIQTVSTHQHAIAAIEQQRPSLLLIDINLEGKFEGITLAQVVKKRFALPFIFVTAYADPDTISRAVETEPLAYLVKPVDQATLIANLRLAAHKLHPNGGHENTCQLQIGKDTVTIDLERLQYIEAFANYMELVYADGKKSILRTTMAHLEAVLPRELQRVHKSYIINRRFLNSISHYRVIVGDKVLPIGRAYSKKLAE